MGMQLSYGYLLILMELSCKLGPVVHINAFICIRFENLDLSVEVDDEANMVILAICHKALNGRLCVSCRHEYDIAGFSVF